jgi:hypothetical protein
MGYIEYHAEKAAVKGMRVMGRGFLYLVVYVWVTPFILIRALFRALSGRPAFNSGPGAHELSSPVTHELLLVPPRVTQAWIETNVPTLTQVQFAELMTALRARGWSDADLASRVIPHSHL